ncbi:Uncharacterised protein [Bordetella pertussis]|nr:Uncharacterised protein [Bordetella pertussis]
MSRISMARSAPSASWCSHSQRAAIEARCMRGRGSVPNSTTTAVVSASGSMATKASTSRPW